MEQSRSPIIQTGQHPTKNQALPPDQSYWSGHSDHYSHALNPVSGHYIPKSPRIRKNPELKRVSEQPSGPQGNHEAGRQYRKQRFG